MNHIQSSFLKALWLHPGLGAVFCLGFAMIKGLNPQAATWIEILLLVSVLGLMPLGHRLIQAAPGLNALERLAGLALGLSLLFPEWLGKAGAILWLVSTVLRALDTLKSWWLAPSFNPVRLCQVAALAFPVIGASWLLAYQWRWQPFGFDALIVLLTAAHFHHAGFTLPLLAGEVGHRLPGTTSRLSCSAILAGVPLVALGITATHFHQLSWLEPLSVFILVMGALGQTTLQLRLAGRRDLSLSARCLWGISGLSLIVAMLLALGYGLRTWLPQGALALSSMWAVHGTLNTFGFGLGGLLAWRASKHR